MAKFRSIAVLSLVCSFSSAFAATYQVGPSRTYTTLNALFSGQDLNGGDIVEVDQAVYAGGVIVPANDGGSVGNPVIIRGLRNANQRPIISGATNTVEFRQSDHLVFEGFEISGGTSRCILMGAHQVTVRDSIIRDCPAHGILSTDQLSGSFTLEHSEIYNAGNGTSQHALYIQSDEIAHPNAVFRMRFNYVHSGTGGNLLKSRHQRNEIYYNWFQGAFYHELELIGPDQFTQQAGWSEDLIREDSDVVGNVIVHSNPAFSAAIRVGGDGTGQSKGRVRFVNNTILLTSGVSVTVFRIFEGIQSVEMHNNVIDAIGSSPPRIERTVEAVWTHGRQIWGSNNWIESGSTFVPPIGEWSNTTQGTDPGFTNSTGFNLTPAVGSALLNTANSAPTSAASFAFPSPLFPPAFHPQRTLMAIGSEQARPIDAALDIGAFESGDQALFANGFEAP